MAEPLHFDDEFLIRYIDGELGMEQREAIEAALSSSLPLQQRLEELKLAIYATRRLGAMEKVKAVHQQMMQELPYSGKKTPVRRMVRFSLGIAASILLLFFAYRYYQSATVDSNRLFQEAYVEFDVNATRNQNHKTELEKAYGAKEYNNAISLVPVSEMDSLLKALSYLHLSQTNEAIRWLQAVQNAGKEYKPDAEFYLSLAYLRNKEYQKTYDLVQEIRTNPMHIYKDQYSDTFINQLEKLNQQTK